jgi:hypothetical protein
MSCNCRIEVGFRQPSAAASLPETPNTTVTLTNALMGLEAAFLVLLATTSIPNRSLLAPPSRGAFHPRCSSGSLLRLDASRIRFGRTPYDAHKQDMPPYCRSTCHRPSFFTKK